MTLAMLGDLLLDAAIDTLKLIPFLFITYLFMEFLEQKTGEKQLNIMEKAGHFGPALGAAIGIIPQCGFAGASSSLYAGRVITMGTLLAVFLSTSDEMLPILISSAMNPLTILEILGLKFLCGLLAGLLVDFVYRRLHTARMHENEIHCVCEQEHCHCEKGILHSAIKHTLQITVFILIVNILLGLLIAFIGEDSLAAFMTANKTLSCFLTALVGLIPNCAASVLITQLYVQGILSFSAMMSGLLTGAGVGLLLLFRTNKKLRENLVILGLLYVFGVVFGLLFELMPFLK